MNAGILKMVTITPFKSPTNAPHPIPTAQPKAIEFVPFMTIAAKQADIATLAPIERSKPPQRITKVKPDATKKIKLACRKTFNKFVDDVKAGAKNAKLAASRNNTNTRFATDFCSGDNCSASLAFMAVLFICDLAQTQSKERQSQQHPQQPPERKKA
jgi:hypothetical protein